MIEKEKKKKLLLVFLLVVMCLILFSSYIKTTEIELSSIFGQNNESKQKELLFETDNEIKKEVIEPKRDISKNKNDLTVKPEKKNKIETIALTKEIKDPFKNDQSVNDLAEEKNENRSGNTINKTEELVFLEKNMIADNLSSSTQIKEKMTESKKEIPEKSSLPAAANKEKIMRADRRRLSNIQLPFRLIGIIKNSTNSSALFLYEGQTLLKRENESIDVFKIEKIKNNNLTISYQKEERIIYLWKEKNNENY
ncbi:hypothetical protein DFR79_10694 [Halanaerobium saccharolyticum]|uniref:Uncharacterized protein n=1 Tax=Halanaerobium saccharolyticum TaxID=43595 RepID=A0A4R6LUD2_9FIRM|nr:hypothetical protein [Halanaerobium saccharolyticum]TDO92281.1 hypothetical protein DFR79_10694 [Halanaerobium saccharolyticum]